MSNSQTSVQTSAPSSPKNVPEQKPRQDDVNPMALDVARLFFQYQVTFYPHLPIERRMLQRLFDAQIERVLQPGMKRSDVRFGEVLFALARVLKVVRVEKKDSLRWLDVPTWHQPMPSPGEPLFPNYTTPPQNQILRPENVIKNMVDFYRPYPQQHQISTANWPVVERGGWNSAAIRAPPSSSSPPTSTKDDVTGSCEPGFRGPNPNRKSSSIRPAKSIQMDPGVEPNALILAERFWKLMTTGSSFWNVPNQRADLENDFEDVRDQLSTPDDEDDLSTIGFNKVLYALARGMKVVRVVKGREIHEVSK